MQDKYFLKSLVMVSFLVIVIGLFVSSLTKVENKMKQENERVQQELIVEFNELMNVDSSTIDAEESRSEYTVREGNKLYKVILNEDDLTIERIIDGNEIIFEKEGESK